MAPGDVGVFAALQDANRGIDGDRRAEDRPARAILDQAPGDRNAGRLIGRGQDPGALGLDLALLIGCETWPDQLFGEVRRRRDQHQALDPLRPGQGDQAGDPAAHGGADQHHRPLGQVIEHRQGVLAPTGDGPLAKVAARGAMTEIVEAEIVLTGRSSPPRQMLGLGPAHVRGETAQPQHRGAAARRPPPGDRMSVRTPQISVDLAHGAASLVSVDRLRHEIDFPCPGHQAWSDRRVRPVAAGHAAHPGGSSQGGHHPSDHPAVRAAGPVEPVFQPRRDRRRHQGLRDHLDPGGLDQALQVRPRL